MQARFWSWEEPQKGSVAVMVAFMLTALVGLVALGTDAGLVVMQGQRLSSVIDAASLAGVQYLPESPADADAAVRHYLTLNGVDGGSAQIEFLDQNRTLRVRHSKNVPLHFARMVGIDDTNVNGFAGAQKASLSAVQGAAPLGVPADSWEVGSRVALKLGAGDDGAGPGNYFALALGQGGASAYEENLKYGYPEWIRMDDWIVTETGNMAGPAVRAVNYRINLDPDVTWETVQRGSPRLLIVPVLEGFDVNGKGEVHALGFAVFFVEGATDTGDDKGEIYGRFVRTAVEGETSLNAPDFGAYAMKLID